MAINKPSIFYAWAETGSVTDPGIPKTQLGWLSEIPTFQNFNWVLNRQDVFNQHVNERGICEHDLITSYIIGSLVTGSDGYVYKSLTDPNLGNDPVGDGGVNQPNINWILDSVDNRWFDHGDTPEYLSNLSVKFTGVDLTARYPTRTRVKISGAATGVIRADVTGALYILGDTRLTLVIDNNGAISNEALDYIRVSTFKKGDSNLPYGLGGLENSGSSSAAQSVLRRIRVQGSPLSGSTQLAMATPDTTIKNSSTIGTSSNALFKDNNFLEIGIDNVSDRVSINNISGKTLNIRTSLNKLVWVNTAVLDASSLVQDLGADGILEIQVSNKDTADPRALFCVIETDASSNAFAQSVLTKNHFI